MEKRTHTQVSKFRCHNLVCGRKIGGYNLHSPQEISTLLQIIVDRKYQNVVLNPNCPLKDFPKLPAIFLLLGTSHTTLVATWETNNAKDIRQIQPHRDGCFDSVQCGYCSIRLPPT